MFGDRNHQFIYQDVHHAIGPGQLIRGWTTTTSEGCNGLHRVQMPISSRIYGMICPN